MFPIEVKDKTGIVNSISIVEPDLLHIEMPDGSYYIRRFTDCWKLEDNNRTGFYQTPPEVREVIDRLLANKAFW
jgi:hypothetical protein